MYIWREKYNTENDEKTNIVFIIHFKILLEKPVNFDYYAYLKHTR